MAESLDNSENNLEAQNQYLYGGFNRISSYDPNMCTTAARFSPFYEKNNTVLPNEGTEMTYKNLTYAQSTNEKVHADDSSNSLDPTNDASKTVDPSYLNYNSELLIEQQNVGAQVFVQNQIESTVTFNDEEEQDVSVLCNGNGIDYVHQIDQGINEVTGEPITAGIVLHRSPNGHLYQNFYVTNDGETPGEIVELVPIDTCNTNRLGAIEGDSYVMQPYDFPTECNMETFETHLHDENQQMISHENDKNHGQLLAAQMLEREQQRILLERTMSPLLAAVNDITQRDAELLSYLNQHVEKEQVMQETAHAQEEYPTELTELNGEQYSEDDDDYILVSDKPVESRARATLPTKYVYLGAVNADTNEPSVFAKKAIPQRTKFGPFEGEIRFTSDIFLNILRAQDPRHYPLLLVGKSRVLIVTNENTSNWMRFVRLAQSYAEQNLQIIEENGRIYFKCNRDITTKEELRAGYHKTYADKYGLPILEPSMKDAQKKYELDNPWMCFECDQRFATSKDIQRHLEVHDVEDASFIISKRKIKRKRKNIKKISELPKNSSRCLVCYKVFMTNSSLKKHFATHLTAVKSRPARIGARTGAKMSERFPYKCSLCNRKFPTEDKLTSHQLSHSNEKEKLHKCPHCDQHCATPAALAAHVRSHTNRVYSCIYCQQTYKYVVDFKQHFEQHCIDGHYPCIHCNKKYKKYHLARKHIRIFHPAVKYPCNECDRLFFHMSYLRRHKASHEKKKNLHCSECELKFERKPDLKQHMKSVHKVKRKVKKKTATAREKKHANVENDGSQYLQLTPKKKNLASEAKVHFACSEGYLKHPFKCEDCKLGFKRRGMLVNHISKLHPDRNIDSVEVLNQPIVKLQTIFNCPHCSKTYKNNAKRKLHILKNHPGMEVPPSFRGNSALDDANVQTVGCFKTDVHKCRLCFKQYAIRNCLLAHYRKSHPNERIPEISPVIPPSEVILIREESVDQVMDIFRPPVSPENKLLKLSSAALELSSIEDRKYFDFLNERSVTTDIVDGNRSSYKIEESEFGETSSNTELSHLPELFEACI